MSKKLPMYVAAQTRIAVVDYDLCDPDRCQLECVKSCPVNRQGKDCIVIDKGINKAVISETLCIGCHLCYSCPFDAITIVNLTAKLEHPMQQWGINDFRLHGLPFPREGAIVGLIGRNGIGKSTAIKILSGQLIPNLGNYDGEASFDSVINFFKGKEIQSYFIKLKKGDVSFALKPQNIELIPKKFSGKVRDLLSKADEHGKLEELAAKLEIYSILDREIENVSGGELQRIALCSTLLKDADFYFIDEPTTYLDVRQRLNAAKLIREVAEQKKTVMVVEHDLAVLDYLSDYVHILFGEKGVYGAVSKVYSARNGINEYLSGYLKTENLRFRDKELRFNYPPQDKFIEREKFIDYPEMQKSFQGFSLSVESGDLRKGEVLGVLGPNAIGKTTFVKMLANIEKPDNAELGWNFKIGYKPQYLAPESGKIVADIFSSNLDTHLFKTVINARLKIEKLFNKQLGHLSGGELQKVSVAYTLSMEQPHILLFDEPSAFLDIEDRLATAEAIRDVANVKGIPCIVVDHDILFQDYVSDRLIVFDGEPAKQGKALKPMGLEQGMNHFLKNLGITYRRDHQTGRPRANKPGSVLDQEQKKSGQYYYVSR